MSPENFSDYLVRRVFEFNEFGSTDALLSAIDEANKIENFNDRKHAFNQIADKAPLRTGESLYCTVHSTFADELRTEVVLFKAFKQMRRKSRGDKTP